MRFPGKAPGVLLMTFAGTSLVLDTLQELSLCGVMHPTQGLLQAVGESSNLARLDLSHMELPAHPSLPALLEKSRHKIQILRLMKTIITVCLLYNTSI